MRQINKEREREREREREKRVRKRQGKQDGGEDERVYPGAAFIGVLLRRRETLFLQNA